MTLKAPRQRRKHTRFYEPPRRKPKLPAIPTSRHLEIVVEEHFDHQHMFHFRPRPKRGRDE